MSHRALNPEQFHHQILSTPEFSNVPDLTYEKSTASTRLRDEIPEPEDEDIGAEGKRIS